MKDAGTASLGRHTAGRVGSQCSSSSSSAAPKVATGTPEDVRRLAMGGEIVTVTGPDLNRHAVAAIREVDGVKKVTWAGSDQLKVIVDDAGTAVPELMDALRAAEIEVNEVSEEHASFDDVFVELMAGQEGEDRAQSHR